MGEINAFMERRKISRIEWSLVMVAREIWIHFGILERSLYQDWSNQVRHAHNRDDFLIEINLFFINFRIFHKETHYLLILLLCLFPEFLIFCDLIFTRHLTWVGFPPQKSYFSCFTLIKKEEKRAWGFYEQGGKGRFPKMEWYILFYEGDEIFTMATSLLYP